MKIAIGCDHGGLSHKNAICEHLKERGFDVEDFGIYEQVSVDYPTIAEKVCESIVSGKNELGILVCGTGIGMSIAANKVKGVRAGVCSDVATAHLIKEHNNANIIAFGARIVGSELAKDIVKAYLEAEFMGGRHQMRVDMISDLEA